MVVQLSASWAAKEFRHRRSGAGARAGLDVTVFNVVVFAWASSSIP